MVPVVSLTGGGIQEDPRNCLKLVMQKCSVSACRVFGASREDRRVKKESMLGLELSLMNVMMLIKCCIMQGQTEECKSGSGEAKLVHHCLVLASILFMQ